MSDYRYKIYFLQKVENRDDYGEPTETWTSFASTWASKEPILGKEYFTALTVDTKVDVKFNCRYIPGVKNDMRIQHGDELYEIQSAINVKGLNRELLCYCRLVD